MKQSIRYFLTVALLTTFSCAGAQTLDFFDAMRELTQIQSNFLVTGNGTMSCQLRYLYSSVSRPQTYLDSLTGFYRIAGSNKYTKIGNIEVLQNDSMIVGIYHTQKLMIISPNQFRQNPSQSIFINTVDSNFILQNVKTITKTTSGKLSTLVFQFNESSLYDSCAMVYDSKTYIPVKIAYTAKSFRTTAADGSTDTQMITIAFSNYGHPLFDISLNDVSQFIVNLPGRKHKVALAYASYSLFDNNN